MSIRVLIVEDSPVMQQLLTALIDAEDDMEVIGVASDPFEARERIKVLNPDVITLDVEMPRMDGITFLEKLMRLRPMPVVMVSSLTEANATVTLRALELGAVDFATKPLLDGRGGADAFGLELCEKLRGAARADIRPLRTGGPLAAVPLQVFRSGSVIAIGASTGGTEAIKEILTRFPSNAPPVVIVQHMPEMFTRMFAKRLDALCGLEVTEAANGDVLTSGHAYVAPGDWHMQVVRNAGGLAIRLDQSDPVNRHRPAVDVLFNSLAHCGGNKVAAALLTGMGRDGADGLGVLRAAGAATFAQDRESCVVFGMPKAAIDAGHAEHVAPVETLAALILESAQITRERPEAPDRRKM